MPVPFSFNPLRGARKTIKWNVTEMSLGSGYSVAAASGRTVTWQLEFIPYCDGTKDDLVSAFIQAGAVDTLLWTPPDHEESKFVVEEWDMKPLGPDAYQVSAAFRLVENEVLSGGNQPDPCFDPDYTLSPQPYIRTLDLVAQYGSTQATKIRHTSLRFADQYEQRNYDDRLRSVFESWSVQVRAMTYSEAYELDEFLNVPPRGGLVQVG